jgi:hypothetical protein
VADLIEIESECPICKTRHSQSFTREDLAELLRYESVTLYCPRSEKSWQATREQRESFVRLLAIAKRLI